MTGKLHLDLGEDYEFSPRRAKAVAEGDTTTLPPPPPDQFVDGPNESQYGLEYWLQRDEGGGWWIWFDLDADPDPDIRQPLPTFLGNPAIDQRYRGDVGARAVELGYNA